MIKGDIVGDKKVYFWLGEYKTKTVEKIDAAINSLTQKLSRNAISKASGGVLGRKSGELVVAVRRGTFVTKSKGRIKGVVGLVGASKKVAIYGASQEYGASIKARLMSAKQVSKLRFTIGNEFKFAKQVQIPAFKLPARSFLRSALREIQGEAESAISNAARIEQ